MPAIEYVPGNTFFHKAHPIIKIALLLSVTCLVFTAVNIPFLFLVLCFIVGMWVVVRVPIKYYKLTFAVAVLEVIFFIIMQGFFYAGNKTPLLNPVIPTWVPFLGGWGVYYLEGFYFGIAMSLRLLAIIMLMPLIVLATPVTDMVIGLRQMKVPYNYAFITTTALRFLPLLMDTQSTIMDAQKLRGLETEKVGFMKRLRAYIPIMVPLIITSWKLSEDLEISIEARAFGATKHRTYIRKILLKNLDKIVIVAIVVLTAILVVGNLFIWPTVL